MASWRVGSGIATPQSVMELVKQRLLRAIEIDRELEKE
jgi:hypothetical protein